MATATKIAPANKGSIGHGTGGTSERYFGGVQYVEFKNETTNFSTSQYVFPVYDPATKETNYYITEKSFNGRNEYIAPDATYTQSDAAENIPSVNPDNLIGTRTASGEWEANDNYEGNFSNTIKAGFANSESTQNSLEYSATETVRSGLQQQNEGKLVTPTQLQEALGIDEPQASALIGSRTEEAAAENGGTAPTTETPEQPEITGPIGELTIGDVQDAGFKSKTGKSDLIYPERSKPTNTDYVKFTALEYAPASTSSQGFSFNYSENTPIGGVSVYLPIQGTIADSNGFGWNEETINAAQIAGAAIAVKTLSGGINAGLSEVNNQLSKAAGNSEAVKNAIKAATAEAAVGANILPRVSRAIFNPNTELLFQGPQLRSFSFTFKLTPRSKDEAAIVKDIIKFFKKNMAAKTTNEELFLKAPNVFKVQYLRKDATHDGINLIKDCALQSFNVDYTPDGSYMSYEDGSMFSYSLQLTFMELLPIYSKDYDSGEGSTHSIGY